MPELEGGREHSWLGASHHNEILEDEDHDVRVEYGGIGCKSAPYVKINGVDELNGKGISSFHFSQLLFQYFTFQFQK